jgi:hypothetical protein
VAAVSALAAFLWCAYALTSFRTVLVLLVTSLLFAEAWAGAEEALWRAEAPLLVPGSSADPASGFDPFADSLGVSHGTIYRSRWWPFRHHSLSYDPQTGLFGGHD